MESFTARARDELFSREVFDTVREARVMYKDWRHRYTITIRTARSAG